VPNDRVIVIDASGLVEEVQERVWSAFERAFA
jgi:hypothetical protein